jgi:hypothetical protein
MNAFPIGGVMGTYFGFSLISSDIHPPTQTLQRIQFLRIGNALFQCVTLERVHVLAYLTTHFNSKSYMTKNISVTIVKFSPCGDRGIRIVPP